MRKLRGVLVLAACAVIAVVVAGVALADPFHLRHIRWFTASAVLLAVLLVTAAFALLAPRGVVRLIVLGLGAVAALGWVGIVALATQVTVENRSVSEVTDAGRRLVVVESEPVAARPVYAVVVRAGTGVFEQEAVVYQGVEAGPVPSEVRFVDADTVEVRTGPCVYRSEVEAVTLAVDPVHRTLRHDTC
ncbi:hypothetical protein FHX44_112500 [Pseudonocardia hierapolitana]|uniref:Uncharacterized protein n=1 Tax=Pseudonocardia hierapolitana TaxID=1128676 RepID=A0A561SP26_9PSEU|nr:hypothetical protein [Pseudonocardia hierapolitana]TWF76607.1 hypothetical protein FHX44_112500 [Pseudonocardia hierapolitana]